MAALTTALLAYLKAGDHVVSDTRVYNICRLYHQNTLHLLIIELASFIAGVMYAMLQIV